jgi:uncharacterized membrane protein YhfC
MKTKIVNSIFPPIFGILTVLVILVGAALLYNRQTTLSYLIQNDRNFYIYFVSASIILAIIIQFALTLPVWKRFKNKNKVMGLKLVPFTIIICIVSGLAFGLIFGDTQFGIGDLLMGILYSVIASAVYWTINLLTIQFFDRQFGLKEKKYAT